MLTFSGFGQLPIAVSPEPIAPSSRRRVTAPLTTEAAPMAVAPAPAPACPYGYSENQGVCVSDGCVDGKSQCIVLDGNGQTCSYDQYLAYWHASGVQSCGPTPQAQPSPVATTPPPPLTYNCSDGSIVQDPSLCPTVMTAPPGPSSTPPQTYQCPDGTLVGDPSYCLPATGAQSGAQPTDYPPMDPSMMPPQTVVSPPILPDLDTGTFWTPNMILGLGAVASIAAAFLAYKTEGSTRAIATIGAVGIGGFTAYKALQLNGILPMPAV